MKTKIKDAVNNYEHDLSIFCGNRTLKIFYENRLEMMQIVEMSGKAEHIHELQRLSKRLKIALMRMKDNEDNSEMKKSIDSLLTRQFQDVEITEEDIKGQRIVEERIDQYRIKKMQALEFSLLIFKLSPYTEHFVTVESRNLLLSILVNELIKAK